MKKLWMTMSLMLAMAGCGGTTMPMPDLAGASPDMAGTTGATHMVLVGQGGNVFSPSTLTVAVNDKVIWDFKGFHNVTSKSGSSEEFDSPSQGSGTKFEHVFTKAGSNPYECTIHAGMNGTITVQ